MITNDLQNADQADDDVTDAHLTVDLVATGGEDQAAPTHVLLIKRGGEPFRNRWALPGGYVKKSENFEQAARREYQEEVGLEAPRSLQLADLRGEPGRDPRHHRVVSAVFAGHTRLMPVPTAGDDAREACWMPVKDLPQIQRQMAFDHADILRKQGLLPEEAAAGVAPVPFASR